MTVLHIAYTMTGGAGGALRRHHLWRLANGLPSSVLTARPEQHLAPNASAIIELPGEKPGPAADLAAWLEPLVGATRWSAPATWRIFDWPEYRDAEVIELRQLHSAGGHEFFNLAALTRLCREKPVVWRLSDMWPFTGYCAYAFDCDKWRDGCRGGCPQMGAERRRMEIRWQKFDTAARRWAWRANLYRSLDLHVVCPSRWMMEQVLQSPLGRSGRVSLVPVGVDAEVFAPSPRAAVRAAMGIPDDDFVIAASLPSLTNWRKGGDLLLETIGRLPEKAGVTLLVIGSHVRRQVAGVAARSTGLVRDEAQHAWYLSAADVLCFSSRCDNSPQTVLEAASVGLPVVAFDAGGIRDFVRDGESGRLVPVGDTAAMADALDRYRLSADLRRAHGAAGRRLILDGHTLDHQGRALAEVHRMLLADHKKGRNP